MIRVELCPLATRTAFFEQWSELTREAPPLASAEMFALLRRFVDGEPLVAAAFEDGELIGALPLVRDGDTLNALHTDHSSFSDYVGRTDGADAVWHALAADRRWSRAVFINLPADSPLVLRWPQLALADVSLTVTHDGRRSRHFLLPGFEARLPSKHAANLRRLGRKLPDLSLERLTRFSRAAMEEALALEGAAWKGHNGSSIASRPTVRQMYLAMARLFLRRGRGALYFLRAGDKRIASLLALEDATTLYALKIGYDPAFADYAPGHLIIHQVARDAERRGLVDLDLLGEDDEWKRRWTPLLRHHVTMSIYRPRAAAYVAVHEVAKAHVPHAWVDLAARARAQFSRHACQRDDLVGEHPFGERVAQRLHMGLGIRSGALEVLRPSEPEADPLGAESRYHIGQWVRVASADEIRDTLDDKGKLRGLRLTPSQWSTCGQVHRVYRSVRRIRDDAGHFRRVSGTVLLDGVTCDSAGDELGCGRHCPLFYRDEWLRPAAPATEPVHAEPRRWARVRTLSEIEHTLDRSGRHDGVTFMPEMARWAGRRLAIARRTTEVLELDKRVPTRAPLYVLDGAWCTGDSQGHDNRCDRACALVWHEDWLQLDAA